MKLDECAAGQMVAWEEGGTSYEGMIVKIDQDAETGQPTGVHVLALSEDGEEVPPASGDPLDRDDEWRSIAVGKLTRVLAEQVGE